jgi:GntR family transcriptional regulator
VRLRIDPTSGVPLGRQIVRQIRLAVAAGRVAPGERLPTARDLAAELGVNFHTVRAAYAELAKDGLLDVGQGRGTFVADAAGALSAAELRELVRSHAQRLAADVAGGEVDAARVEELFVEELRRALKKERTEQ